MTLKEEGLEEEMFSPVIMTMSKRVGVMGPCPKKKQFKASDKKYTMVRRRFSSFSRGTRKETGHRLYLWIANEMRRHGQPYGTR